MYPASTGQKSDGAPHARQHPDSNCSAHSPDGSNAASHHGSRNAPVDGAGNLREGCGGHSCGQVYCPYLKVSCMPPDRGEFRKEAFTTGISKARAQVKRMRRADANERDTLEYASVVLFGSESPHFRR